MVDIASNWFSQGEYKDVKPLAVEILELRKELFGQHILILCQQWRIFKSC